MQSDNKELIKEFDEYVSKELDLILQIGNLQEWQYFLYHPKNQKDKNVECNVNHSYLTINIYFNDEILKEYKNKDFKWIRYILCHEISHIYTEELYRMATDCLALPMVPYVEKVREQNTERICKLLIKLLESEEI